MHYSNTTSLHARPGRTQVKVKVVTKKKDKSSRDSIVAGSRKYVTRYWSIISKGCRRDYEPFFFFEFVAQVSLHFTVKRYFKS